MEQLEARVRALELLMHHLLTAHSTLCRQVNLLNQAIPGSAEIRSKMAEEGAEQARLAAEIAQLSSAVLLREPPPADPTR